MEDALPFARIWLVRLAFLRASLAEKPEGAEEMQFVVCDRCGASHDLSEGLPVGWTSRGSLLKGWTDLCRGCSG